VAEGPSTLEEIPPDPFDLFEAWLAEARATEPPDRAEAMALATATVAGLPSARMVMLRGFDRRGFVFHTNYESRKGRELAENPRAALVFHWYELHRQVIVTGDVRPLPRHESEAYFATRPLGHRLSAWASHQDEVIADRSVLERGFAEAAERFGDDPPLPDYWGGYLLTPTTIEFWQGRADRLHDRVRYERTGPDAWRADRLAP
jgi:pyridoxamine 5'-phosphate oxidase